MPSLLTHNIFAKEVAASLDNKYLEKWTIYNEVYLVGSQSFDLLKYNIKKHKSNVTLCKDSHRINVNEYFINLLNICKEEKNNELIAYTLGAITHQVLDSNLHPYIVYKTGIYNGTKEREKYHGEHTLLETRFDMFNVQRSLNTVINKKNIRKLFFPKVKVSKNTINSLNQVFNKLYNKDGGTYLFKGYNVCRRIVNIVRRDTLLNKIVINTLEFLFHDKVVNYVYNQKNISYDYLNINHHKWCYPSDDKICSKKSLIDLYNDSLVIGKDALEKALDYIYGNGNLSDFLKIIGNKGYIRGTDCSKLPPIKFFEY